MARDQNAGVRFGLHRLTSEYAQPTTPSFDIILVHGLMGDRTSTWTHNETEVFWPKDLLLLHFPQARVFCHGYDADVPGTGTGCMDQFALDLLRAVTDEQNRAGHEHGLPLMFISHSLGGIVTEAAVLKSAKSSNSTSRDMVRRLRGMIELGVPHLGSDAVAQNGVFIKMGAVLTNVNNPLLEALERESPQLNAIYADLQAFLEGLGRHVQTECFVEGQLTPVPGLNLWRKIQVVDRQSAILDYRSENSQTINEDHIRMCKFRNADDDGYRKVWSRITDWIPGGLQNGGGLALPRALELPMPPLTGVALTQSVFETRNGQSQPFGSQGSIAWTEKPNLRHVLFARNGRLVHVTQGSENGEEDLGSFVEIAADFRNFMGRRSASTGAATTSGQHGVSRTRPATQPSPSATETVSLPSSSSTQPVSSSWVLLLLGQGLLQAWNTRQVQNSPTMGQYYELLSTGDGSKYFVMKSSGELLIMKNGTKPRRQDFVQFLVSTGINFDQEAIAKALEQEPAEVQQTLSQRSAYGQGRSAAPGMISRPQGGQQPTFPLPVRSRTAPAAISPGPLSNGMNYSQSAQQIPDASARFQQPVYGLYGVMNNQALRQTPQAYGGTQPQLSGTSRNSTPRTAQLGVTSPGSSGQVSAGSQPQSSGPPRTSTSQTVRQSSTSSASSGSYTTARSIQRSPGSSSSRP